MKIPQLRLIATNYCDSRCIYCRPTGEAVYKNNSEMSLSLESAIEISRFYKENGGTDIKITGGDPVYWENLSDCVKILKSSLGIEKVEVITRSVSIIDIIDKLIDNGLDSINFSLDTLDEKKYETITGKNDLEEFLEVIKYCSSKTHCKINTVVMKNVNDGEIKELIHFCGKNNIDEIKLLDVIADLHECEENHSKQLYSKLNKKLSDLYTNLDFVDSLFFNASPTTVFQGGLGHPLKVYHVGNLDVIIKDASYGAWYGNCCNKCHMYPCHDALMALRVLPGNYLQICLMNKDNIYRFNNNKTYDKELFEKCLAFYDSASFKGERIG